MVGVTVSDLCILEQRPAGDFSSHYQLTVSTHNIVFTHTKNEKKLARVVQMQLNTEVQL